MKSKKKILIAIVVALLLIPPLLLSSVDEVDLALSIDVPYQILQEIEEEFGSQWIYFLSIASIDVEYDWQVYEDDNYLEKLKTYNMKLLRDMYRYDDEYKTLFDTYQQAYGDIECFTIPRVTYEKKKKVINEDGTKSTEWIVRLKTPRYTVYDDFGAERNYKEQTRHKGNDTIADEMTPLVSMTDGVLERVGWNEHGGWRIGVRAPSGAYFYYAHMEEYGWEIEEGDLRQGDRIKAGQLLGYIGDTGYGPEGTEGKFVNHLHLQIGVKLEDYEGDFWVNPYNAMKFREDDKKILDVCGDDERPEIISNKKFRKLYED